MKVTSIIENTSKKELPVEHGLSLYIEKDDGQKVLFDMGQSALFAKNANTTKFYTMHCTGEEQYIKLKKLMGDQIEYIACGDHLIIKH